MNQDELKSVLENHEKWLNNDNGQRANLRDAHLQGAHLQGAHLQGAHLQGAHLQGAHLQGAHLQGANLQGANLQGANLQGANLQGANLQGAVGDMKHLKSIFLERWPITYTNTHMQIGCQRCEITEWWGFDDITIHQMDQKALEWWKKYKNLIRQIIELSPAESTDI